MGKESGGDLDTVSSNVFYAIWAQHHLKEALGREPVYGQDYGFDFVNYSEGLHHLVVHRGCDIYLPDFPIDTLVPRIRMLLITEKRVIPCLNEFTRLFTEYRRWMADYAGNVSPELKSVSNEIFLQYAKVVEHQEAEAIQAGNALVYLFYNLAFLSVVEKTKAEPSVASGLKELIDQMLRYATGEDFGELKKKLLDAIQSRDKEELIDNVLEKNLAPDTERAYILSLKQAAEEDRSAWGRINTTEELLILAVETAAYIVRGARLSRELPLTSLNPKVSEKMAGDLEYACRTFQRYFDPLLERMTLLPRAANEDIESAFKNMRTCLLSLVEISDRLRDPPAPEPADGRVPIRLMLMYEASGIAVSNIEILVRRLQGNGTFVLPDGTEHAGPDICRITDRDGVVELFYKPAAAGELCRLGATFDEMNYICVPPETNPNVDTTSSYIEEGMEFNDPEGIDRAMKVSLDLLERQFKFLKDHDITVAAIDDHHPYTPAIFNKLHELKDQGYIGHIRLSSLPRGQEQPRDQQKCGADLIYEQYVQGKPWDNEGLSQLRHLAHCQDLAIERIDLAMQLSRLIGSKHSKIDMVRDIARIVKDAASLEQVMPSMGWTKSVTTMEGKLAQVVPRTEEILGHIVMGRPGADAEGRIHILAVLSPFCDPKKGEPQINVATAMGYLFSRNRYPADYFFYCYGSDMITMRRPNQEDDSLDLCLLGQHLGSRADGGHAGAATCRPGQNPAFPHRLFSKITDLNFLQYLGYLGARISEKSGLRLIDVLPPAGLELTEEQTSALNAMHENSLKLELSRQTPDSDRISVLVVKAPAKNPRIPLGYLQVFHFVRSRLDVQYLIYCQPGLNAMVIQNIQDPAKRLNPDLLAKVFGWPEDAGTDVAGIASGRLNKYIPKKMRQLTGDEDLFRLCQLFGTLLRHNTEYAVKSITKAE